MPSTGLGKEVVEKKLKLRDAGYNMQSYLNQLESICAAPLSDTEKGEAFNQVSLLVGKMIVQFCNIADLTEMFEEFGVRGAKKKDKSLDEIYDQYEYVEEDNK